ncbi:MAG: BRO-N domain-containing protein [Serratia proteamaculans]
MTTLAVTPFTFENHEVRTLLKNGEPWFVAHDICDALKIKNVSQSVERLDTDEKDICLTDTLGGKQEMCVISESGMYTLVLRCRDAVKPGTLPHRFRKWVTSEVLPQIRKTGSYHQQPTHQNELTIPSAPLNYNIMVSIENGVAVRTMLIPADWYVGCVDDWMQAMRDNGAIILRNENEQRAFVKKLVIQRLS